MTKTAAQSWERWRPAGELLHEHQAQLASKMLALPGSAMPRGSFIHNQAKPVP